MYCYIALWRIILQRFLIFIFFLKIFFSYNSALEEADPDAAIQLYADACSILEEDGKEQMAFDLYRAATSVYIKVEK